MVSPAIFIQNHYPDDAKWQLLDTPLDKKSFAEQPLINIADTKFQIQDFSQVNRSKKSKIVRLKFKNMPSYFMVTDRKSKPIPFQKKIEDGVVTFQFSTNNSKKVVIWAGNSRRKMSWMSMFKA